MARHNQNVVFIFSDANGTCYPHNSRAPNLSDIAWPRLLGHAFKANELGNWVVHNDSVPGRSLAGDNFSKDQFIKVLMQYADRTKTPHFILILALGMNDFNCKVSAAQIIEEINWYITFCYSQREDAHIFYVTHPGIVHNRLAGFWERKFRGTRFLEHEFYTLLSGIKCSVLDTRCLGSEIVGDDGIHFTPAGHAAIMQFLYPHVIKVMTIE